MFSRFIQAVFAVQPVIWHLPNPTVVSLHYRSWSASSPTTNRTFCDVSGIRLLFTPPPTHSYYFDCLRLICVGAAVQGTHGPLRRTPRGAGPLLSRLGRKYSQRRECYSMILTPPLTDPRLRESASISGSHDGLFICTPICSGFGPGSSDVGYSYPWYTPSPTHSMHSFATVLPSPDRMPAGVMSDCGVSYFPSS